MYNLKHWYDEYCDKYNIKGFAIANPALIKDGIETEICDCWASSSESEIMYAYADLKESYEF